MAIESECDGCGVQLRVADEHVGRQAKCPQCGLLYTVPAQSSSRQENAEAAGPVPSQSAPTENSPNGDAVEGGWSVSWFVKTLDGQTYGPIDKNEMDRWAAEGRINAQCQIRQSSSDTWQSASAVYPQLTAATAPPSSSAADNPFKDNPYHSPQAKSTSYRQPHRGTLVLVFGILGFLVCIMLSPAAWIMGRNDLKQMDAGVMDPEGRTLTQVGMILGIINSCIMLAGLAFVGLWLVLMFVVGVANM